MPVVPKTGIFVMSGATDGIKECVVAAGGSPATDDIEAVRDAATFELFDAAFLDGATDLSGIVSAEQFRGYGTDFDMISLFFRAVGNMAYGTGNRMIAYVDFYRVSNNSLIGTANVDWLANSTPSRTYQVLNGFTGVNTKCCFYAYFSGSNGLPCFVYINPRSIVDTYGAFYCKIRATLNGGSVNISNDIYPSIDYSSYGSNVNYGKNWTFKSTTPDAVNGAMFNEDTGIAVFPLNYGRTWNSTLITENFSEFY